MFDLEHEVEEWRISLRAGLLCTATIDELESHLREEFASQLQAGFALSEAFGNAVQRLGNISELRAEFGKGDNALPAGHHRLFERLAVGFVHSIDVKVLACTGIVLGLLGAGVFIYGLQQTFRRAHDFVGFPWVRLGASYAAMTLTCLLGIFSSWRYLRLRRIDEARSVIGFNLFIAFILAWGYVAYINRVFFKASPLFHYDSPAMIVYFTGVLLVVAVIWWLWMRRLARLASADPVVR